MSYVAVQRDWRELFRAAVKDWNSKEQAVRLEDASAAIQQRLQASSGSVPADGAERSEMESALYFLTLLSLVR